MEDSITATSTALDSATEISSPESSSSSIADFQKTANTNSPSTAATTTTTTGAGEYSPSSSPTVDVEHKVITDLLSGQFGVTISDSRSDQLLPVNRAVNWMAEELKSFSSSEANGNQVNEFFYDDLTKFGQRFALLTMQYALIDKPFFGMDEDGEIGLNVNDRNNGDNSATAMAMHPSEFLFEQQQGVDECDWEGVTCDDFGRAVGVDFSDNELIGSIPSEISFLHKLQTLDLSSNIIVGTIPEQLYDLEDLQRVYLYQNKLTGTISSWIGQLNSLQYFHLSHNSLSGSIPPQLQSWSNDVFRPLKYLNLYDNNLTGTIPKNLRLRDLFYFDIGRNFISGSIPEEIGIDFVELRYLHIDHNRLTESIPDTIPSMANGRLISFLANHNRLEGVVPDNWIMFNKLVQYTLHENYFDYLGPANCNFNVFEGGQLVEFKADCDICSCNDIFCDAMCSP